MANEYVPGVCNIGAPEIARRKNIGWMGLFFAVALFVVFFWTGVNMCWRLFIFFPAVLSALGFLQAYFSFCVGFARNGVFNFDSLGKTIVVKDEISKIKDRKKGRRITLYAVVIAMIVAIACVFA